MSALNFAKQAFLREKPHSSITDWVEILTSSGIEDEAYDGIPELVDAINLQGAGPVEASRALRKKLKHGNPHQQYRALVELIVPQILKALVENCGTKFISSFADGQLTDAIKNLSADHSADKKVRKKLLAVLASWHEQFKSDPSMSAIAGLYKQCSREGRRQSYHDVAHLIGMPLEEKKKKDEEEAKQAVKREKEQAKARKLDEERQKRLRQSQPARTPFVFEKDKPKVLASIVEASQASSNLINAITLVNPKTDDVRTNERVQECLEKAKLARKPVIRYIQLVENEELIGTLIETNERIMGALEKYEQVAAGGAIETTDALAEELGSTHIASHDTGRRTDGSHSLLGSQSNDRHLHPDLQDLDFGPLGASSSNLPPPLKPSALSDDDDGREDTRGSLSDFSDYSSDEETHAARNAASKQTGQSSKGYTYTGMDDYSRTPLNRHNTGDDPFADPFADEVTVGPSKRW
ncbi:hypothetical protein H0H93_014192 [Arthromyces matolae]|nr:hypothetical protein H0H93_014192 [Arthromyces matolae]